MEFTSSHLFPTCVSHASVHPASLTVSSNGSTLLGPITHKMPQERTQIPHSHSQSITPVTEVQSVLELYKALEHYYFFGLKTLSWFPFSLRGKAEPWLCPSFQFPITLFQLHSSTCSSLPCNPKCPTQPTLVTVTSIFFSAKSLLPTEAFPLSPTPKEAIRPPGHLLPTWLYFLHHTGHYWTCTLTYLFSWILSFSPGKMGAAWRQGCPSLMSLLALEHNKQEV